MPPKCLFPETRDIELIYDANFRQSLITVPSCDKHNLAKAHDDEYLMVCLGSKFGNNGVAYVHTNTKIRRAIERNPKLISAQAEDVVSIGDENFPVLFVKVDNFRLMRSFEAIARALVFHELNFRHRGRCQVISDIFISLEDQKATRFQLESFSLISNERMSWSAEIKGANPKIFTYQFSESDGFGTFTVALIFYEKIVIYVICTSGSLRIPKP